MSMNYISNCRKESRNINDREGGDDTDIEGSEYARWFGELQLNEEKGARCVTTAGGIILK